MALIQAINAFEISIGHQRSGKILPGSPTEAAMVSLLPNDMRDMRAIAGTNFIHFSR